jgi:hypothetical protein
MWWKKLKTYSSTASKTKHRRESTQLMDRLGTTCKSPVEKQWTILLPLLQALVFRPLLFLKSHWTVPLLHLHFRPGELTWPTDLFCVGVKPPLNQQMTSHMLEDVPLLYFSKWRCGLVGLCRLPGSSISAIWNSWGRVVTTCGFYRSWEGCHKGSEVADVGCGRREVDWDTNDKLIYLLYTSNDFISWFKGGSFV